MEGDRDGEAREGRERHGDPSAIFEGLAVLYNAEVPVDWGQRPRWHQRGTVQGTRSRARRRAVRPTRPSVRKPTPTSVAAANTTGHCRWRCTSASYCRHISLTTTDIQLKPRDASGRAQSRARAGAAEVWQETWHDAQCGSRVRAARCRLPPCGHAPPSAARARRAVAVGEAYMLPVCSPAFPPSESGSGRPRSAWPA